MIHTQQSIHTSHHVVLSGNSGSAFVEVLVKSSHDAEYISLLPQSIMMSSEESRSGRNHMRIKVFSKGTTLNSWIT